MYGGDILQVPEHNIANEFLTKNMSQTAPLLERLPPEISAGKIGLYAFSFLPSWSAIKKMGPSEKQYINGNINLPPQYRNFFSRYNRFVDFCDFIRLFERHDSTNPNLYLPQRYYFSYNIRSNLLVGLLRAYIPQADKDVLSISYDTRPEFRGSGYATTAAQALSNAALDKRITPCVCAETDLDNEPSARVLLKSGFTEAAQGTCSTTNSQKYRGKVVRRFIKASVAPGNWPLTPSLLP